ncbi:hypothetical protein [Gordonia sp. NB41Y]|uniref:hypothetical protein n=1 Tax=Gordonia sp. NB41Y TaxID=875808 RepID=UPI0006B23252|nr:hypothetical protein [Gordonia sp. NB41Y]EMP10810.2 hypothetical protein ISGA_3852 [Gordonia sp. NB41Y]WLP89115.1 hypothetical protein Q9K23_16080 [Gordonia sp. NB41Y]
MNEHFIDQSAASFDAGNWTNANVHLFEIPWVRSQLDRKLAPVSPTARDVLMLMSYLESNAPDRERQPYREHGYNKEALRDLWCEAGSAHDLAVEEAAFDNYVERVADNGRPAHSVQLYDWAYYRDHQGEQPDYDDPPQYATGVVTWPVLLHSSVERVMLALIHGGCMTCGLCGTVKGRMCDVEGYGTSCRCTSALSRGCIRSVAGV